MEIPEAVIKYYQVALDKLLPAIQKNTKKTYIGAAIALITLQRIYSFFRVPKQLRHIIKIPYFPMVKAYCYREPPYSRFNRIILPAIGKTNGLYLSKIPFNWTVFITSPTAAKQILMKADANPKSTSFVDVLGPNTPIVRFLGRDNVIFANGHTWKNQRKIMNPAFHRSMPVKTMASVIPTLFSYIEQENGTILISPTMKNFTLDLLGLSIFGFEFKAMTGDPENWTSTYKLVNKGLFDPLLNVMGSFSFLLAFFSEKRRQLDAVTKLNNKLTQLAEKKRKEVQEDFQSGKPEHEKDLVTLMLEAEQRGEGITSDEQLRHNIAILFLAGHETTAHTLAFCLYNLAKNKNVQNKLRQEVINVLGDEPMDVEPTLEQLKGFKYMDLVIKENLRLNGPVDRLVTRILKEDIIVDGVFVPKGTTVNVDLFAIHHNPRYWVNADQFIPERFEEGGEHDDHEGLTWLPFGNGARQCVGMNFSLTEQRLVLAMIVRKYEISVPENSIHYDHVVIDQVTTKAPDSLEITFTKRY
ncbi:unnamed protein product [Rhizopus stolonifer]